MTLLPVFVSETSLILELVTQGIGLCTSNVFHLAVSSDLLGAMLKFSLFLGAIMCSTQVVRRRFGITGVSPSGGFVVT